jgi:hypothetical protein
MKTMSIFIVAIFAFSYVALDCDSADAASLKRRIDGISVRIRLVPPCIEGWI